MVLIYSSIDFPKSPLEYSYSALLNDISAIFFFSKPNLSAYKTASSKNFFSKKISNFSLVFFSFNLAIYFFTGVSSKNAYK